MGVRLPQQPQRLVVTGDAATIAAAVRSKQVSAFETVTAHLERIEASDLNAFTLIDRARALAAAQRVDEAVEGGHDPGPLAGVPIALKDLIDQAGVVNTAGSKFYRHTPDRSAVVVRRLETAGAIPVGRTGLHEFAFGFSSENHWFGPVRNPWDRSTSAGGSSGGSGAAVAGGLAPIGIGTDTGGSVRVPAALCGVVGLKVTHGRIPISGVFPLAPSLDTIGPLARSVTDIGIAYSVMKGRDVADPWSMNQSGPEPDIPSLERLRIGVPADWIASAPMSNTIAAAFSTAQEALRPHVASIGECRVPEGIPGAELIASVYGEVGAVHREFRATGREYGPEVEERMQDAGRVTLDQYIGGLKWRARLRQSLSRVFEDFDLVITPATGVTSKSIGVDDVPVEGGTVHYRTALSYFSATVNHAGVPALVAPLAEPGDPPPALQIIAPWWAEERLLAFGEALEGLGIVVVRKAPDAR